MIPGDLDPVEMVMWMEEFFETEIPDHESERFGTPSEILDSLERRLSNQRPNQRAAALLRKLAKDQNWPELVEGSDGPWRREQIAAVVRELLR
jgi:hypothetical protein